MKIQLFLLAFIGLNITLNAQVPLQCGTAPGYTALDTTEVPWYGNNAILYDYLDDNAELLLDRNPLDYKSLEDCSEKISAPRTIPIKFWIWRENESDNPISDFQIQQAMDVINESFISNGMNFRFYSICPEFPINSSYIEVIGDELEELNDNGRHENKAINIHVVETGQNNSDPMSGWGGTYTTAGDFIAVTRDAFESVEQANRVLPHELGHYFNLDHPHESTWESHHLGNACCAREPVSRGKVKTKLCLGCVFLPVKKKRKRCHKSGDYLCDTPADPWGVHDIDDNNNCVYLSDWTDEHGQVYEPDMRNYMSYYSFCTSRFSNQQKAIMFDNMYYSRFWILDINQSIVEPDSYEPDNTDYSNVPRLISVGESQCHSMHTVYQNPDCDDSEDWLRIENENGLIGSYIIKINDIELENNPVEEIIIYNTSNSGERTEEIIPIFTDNGTERIWEIPCDALSTNTLTPNPNDYNDFLIQILRRERDAGLYTISLQTSDPLPIVKGQSQVCLGETFSVLSLPQNATVVWSSENIILSTTTGTSTTIEGASATGPYILNATIFQTGCKYTITKIFSEVGEGNLPEIGNINMNVTGSPCEPYFSFSISPVAGSTAVEWECSANIMNFSGCIEGNNPTSIYATANLAENDVLEIEISVTAINDCDAKVTKSRVVTYVPSGDCTQHIGTGGGGNDNIDERIVQVSPNPVNQSEFTLEIIEPIDVISDSPIYQIAIISQYGDVDYMIESMEQVHQISTVNLVKGLYYAEVITNNDVKTTIFYVDK